MFSQASVILFTGGGCLADTLGQTPPPPETLLQRTVRILLECILVLCLCLCVNIIIIILHAVNLFIIL